MDAIYILVDTKVLNRLSFFESTINFHLNIEWNLSSNNEKNSCRCFLLYWTLCTHKTCLLSISKSKICRWPFWYGSMQGVKSWTLPRLWFALHRPVARNVTRKRVISFKYSALVILDNGQLYELTTCCMVTMGCYYIRIDVWYLRMFGDFIVDVISWCGLRIYDLLGWFLISNRNYVVLKLVYRRSDRRNWVCKTWWSYFVIWYEVRITPFRKVIIVFWSNKW